MKKLTLLLLCLLLSGIHLYSQEQDSTAVVSPWKKVGVVGLNMSQVSLSNWSAGGDNSVAFDLNLAYSLDYTKNKHIWKSRIEMAYGLNNTSTNGVRKTNDKIYLMTNYGYNIAENLFLSAIGTFETQFANGYDYAASTTNPISRFMAPAYITAGLGITHKVDTWLTTVFSPIAWKGTFVNDDTLSAAGAFGVTPGEKFLSEFGGNLNVEFKKNIFENVLLYSRLNLFSNYLRNPQNIDINWDTQISMKVNKWLSATLQLSMIYDDDIKFDDGAGNKVAKLQFKEVLGIGIQVNF